MNRTKPTHNTTVERDTTFWFFDGNIVLLAQGTTAFRVHKGVLAFHSEFFSGMFDQSFPVPHESGDEGELDGCPVVLLEDTAYDIRQLLLVVYGKNRLKEPKDMTFSILAALIRMGHKYGLHDVVTECLPNLRQMVPASLDYYEAARKHRSAIKFAPQHAVEALHIFRLVDLDAHNPRVLAFVLFLCAQLDESELRNGVTRADGTPEKLSDVDIEQILTLKRKLQTRGEQALDAVLEFRGPSDNCEQHNRYGGMFNLYVRDCDTGYHDFIRNIPAWIQDAFRGGDLFGTCVYDRMKEWERGNWVCGACLQDHLDEHQRIQQQSWNALPVLAGTASEKRISGDFC